MDLELRGRTAVVTGCSVGIGREIARVLAAEGVPTLVVARRGDLLKTLQDEIEAAGWVRPHAVPAAPAGGGVRGWGRDSLGTGAQGRGARARRALMSTTRLEGVRGGWSSAVIEEFFAPSYRRHLSPTTAPLTREGQRERANRLRAALPDATVTLEDIFAEGDRVAYRLTIRGTHQGAFQGIPATGKQVTVSFTAIVRIEVGRLIEEWGGLDLFDLRRRLEAVVTAGPDSKHG